MFQACEVKITNMEAHSGPIKLPGNKPMKAATPTGKNPSMGTDCKTSMMGMMMRSARRLLAAHVPKIKVNAKENTKAINMRTTVRAAYSGKADTLSEIGML